MRISNTTSASTSKMWMNPPNVYALTTPSSQSTSRITNIVQSIRFLLVTTRAHVRFIAGLRFVVGLCSLRLIIGGGLYALRLLVPIFPLRDARAYRYQRGVCEA